MTQKPVLPLLLLVAFAACASLALAAEASVPVPVPVEQQPVRVNPQASQTFPEYVGNLSYPVEKHVIRTEDGYLLTYFRIQAKNQKGFQKKPVVYVQHGLLDSSDSWIMNDESKAPGLILANAGYDVWFGNIRGNRYSMDHTKWDPEKNPEFWQFTFQHMAQYDLPAAFEYIGTLTGQVVNYVGHSQGTMIMFANLAEQDPVVLKHLGKFVALGPLTYLKNMSSKLFNILVHSGVPFQAIIQLLKINEFLTPNFISGSIYPLFCHFLPTICTDLIGLIMDANTRLDNMDRIDIYAGHLPAGTSALNMLHFLQMAVQKDYVYQKYDYGKDQNMKIYGQPTAPYYDLSKISVPVHLCAGTSDELADPVDVTHLQAALKNVELRQYDLGHGTFLIGKDTSYFNDVLSILKAGETVEEVVAAQE